MSRKIKTMARLSKIGNFWPGMISFTVLVALLGALNSGVLEQGFVWVIVLPGFALVFFMIRAAFASNSDASYGKPR